MVFDFTRRQGGLIFMAMIILFVMVLFIVTAFSD